MRRVLPSLVLAVAALAALAAAPSSWAQSAFPDPLGKQAVPGTVQMCLNAQGQSVPCPFSDLQPYPDVTLPFKPADASRKALIVTPSPNAFAIAPSATQVAASNSVLKASAGNLYTLTITIGATSGWLMIFDAAALPSNGTTGASLKFCAPVNSNGTNGSLSLSWNPGPPAGFASGIVAGFSTTACNSLTASATAFFYGQVQ